MEMHMNKDVIKGKWTEFKGNLKKVWGKITDDEWEKTKGEATAIYGLIQQRYGQSKGEVNEKLDSIYNSLSANGNSMKSSNAKNSTGSSSNMKSGSSMNSTSDMKKNKSSQTSPNATGGAEPIIDEDMVIDEEDVV